MTGRIQVRRGVAAALIAAVAIGACGSGNQAAGSPSGPVVVTFEVVEERFKALLTDPVDIDTARRLLAGEDVPSIPNGRVLRETGVNEGYSWSLDPNDIRTTAPTASHCGSRTRLARGTMAEPQWHASP